MGGTLYLSYNNTNITRKKTKNMGSTCNSLVTYYCCFLLILVVFTTTVKSHCPSKYKCDDSCFETSQSVSHLIIFGDSHFSAAPQKDCIPSDLWPYGKTIFETTGRFSDGEIVPDFIAKQLGLPRIQPYISTMMTNAPVTIKAIHEHGINFAMVGATAVNDKGLMYQMEEYKKFVNKLTKDEVFYKQDTILYMFSIGGNDYIQKVEPNVFAGISDDPVKLNAEIQKVVDQVITKIMGAVKEVYDLGGRIFAFQNVGPLHLLPAVNLEFNYTQINLLEQLATHHNTKLRETLEAYGRDNNGFTYSILDYYNAIKGFTLNSTTSLVWDTACCGDGLYKGDGCGSLDREGCSDPNNYVFWDGLHNTHSFNSYLADLFWDGTNHHVKPRSLKQITASGQVKVKLIDLLIKM